MKMINKNRKYIFITVLCLYSMVVVAQDPHPMAVQRLNEIKAGLDSSIFVHRFQSVETPCVYIDSVDHTKARVERTVINSNYRILLRKNDTIARYGVKCLSQYYSRYFRLKVTETDNRNLILKGELELTYAYPASSLIQYLGFTNSVSSKTNMFFEKLMRSPGNFIMYPEDNKYRVKISFTDHSDPYNKKDTVFGYFEIVQEVFNPRHQRSYSFYFDQMLIEKGDRNNQIFLKFSSTTHYHEILYYSLMAYNVLKNINSADKYARASAIWLNNYLKNPACTQCRPVYNTANNIINANPSMLPNTEPIPAH